MVKDPARVRDSWNKTFRGSSGANKVAVLEEGMKYTPISISPNEAQFLETRKLQIGEIARIFRASPRMVGDLENPVFRISNSSRLSLSNTRSVPGYRDGGRASQGALIPQEKKNYFIKFNVDGLLRSDYESRMNGYSIGIQNEFTSPNDVLEMENLDLILDEPRGNNYMVKARW